MNDTKTEQNLVQITKASTAPIPAQRRIPRQVQRALLVFCIVGGLVLPTDGVLLVLSITHHHTAQIAQDSQPILRFQAAVLPTTSDVTRTSTNSTRHRYVFKPIFTLSSPNLTFNATQGQSNLASQTVTLSAGKQAFSWLIVPTSALPIWLDLPSLQGNTTTSSTAAFEVGVHPEHLTPGTYTASLQVEAFTSQDKMPIGNPKTLLVTLVVSTACSASVTPTELSFTVAQDAALNSQPQILSLTESSSCALPVKWQARVDAPWIRLSRPLATNTTSNSTVVYIDSFDLPPGPYTATIALQAIDNSGASLVVSPAVITVTLTVTHDNSPRFEP